jgi:lipopolysaccharide export system permease protein
MLFYNKYIFRNLCISLIGVSLILTSIIWLTQSLRYITLVVNKGLSFATFLYLSSLLIPPLLLIALPFATFISVAYVYYKLMHDNELIVLCSSGLSKWSLSKPAINLGIFTTIISLFLSIYLQPLAARELKDKVTYIKNNYSTGFLQTGVFNTPIEGITIFIEDKEDNQLKSILVNDNRVPEKQITIIAETGKLIKTPKGSSFIMNNGSFQEISKEGHLSILHFKDSSLNIDIEENKNDKRVRDAHERFLDELFNPKDVEPKMINKLRSEGHQRLTWPLFNVILSLIALIPIFAGEFNRRFRSQKITYASLIAILIVSINLVLSNIIAKIPSLTFLLYLNIIIVAIISIHHLFKSEISILNSRG